MKRPPGLWHQYEGKADAELARGAGIWPWQPHPCSIIPPWEPYDQQSVTAWDCLYNDWEGPWRAPGVFGIHADLPVVRLGEPLVLPAIAGHEQEEFAYEYAPIRVEHFEADESTYAKAEQFVLSLSALSHPVSFELIGIGSAAGRNQESAPTKESRTSRDPSTTQLQFAAHHDDVAQVTAQLRSAFPNSTIVVDDAGFNESTDWLAARELAEGKGFGVTLHLGKEYIWPLKTHFRFEPDPLGVAVAAFDEFEPSDWGMLQVLFSPVSQPWAETIRSALADPYNEGKYIYSDITHRVLDEKFSSPLFAVSVRLAARRQSHLRHLLGWAEQFAAPPQSWDHYEDDDGNGDFCWALMSHCTYRPGVLLNAKELSSLVHLPGPGLASERLLRSTKRTRPAKVPAPQPGQVVLGENTHRGTTKLAAIEPKLRRHHCYVVGATGTGKSTLLDNMVCQDIVQRKGGIALIDPHGDLVKDILARVPPNRQGDVIYFNAADQQRPVGFNILHAHSHGERDVLVEETLAAFRQHFSEAWGPRLQHILWHALATTVRIPGGTLIELRRLLVDLPFRARIVSRLKHHQLRTFWQKEMPDLPKGASDPILNKLSPFLMNPLVRNIICQRKNALNFDEIIAKKKILLVNLASGKLTHGVAGVIGMMLFTKIASAIFRRGELAKSKRSSFYTYIDEFQNFMNMSANLDLLLTQARKFGLVLTMAHQHTAQLTREMRSSIFGNVGTLISFRVGIDDAQLVARDLQAFQPEEFLRLGVGQAFVRLDTSDNVFNIDTFREPPTIDPDPTEKITTESRQRFGSELKSRRKRASAKPMQAAIPPQSSQEPPAPKRKSRPKPKRKPKKALTNQVRTARPKKEPKTQNPPKPEHDVPRDKPRDDPWHDFVS